MIKGKRQRLLYFVFIYFHLILFAFIYLVIFNCIIATVLFKPLCWWLFFPTQLPQYASTASMYQPEMAGPAPAVASQPGVTHKVSAWLQQTEDIDATSSGQ